MPSISSSGCAQVLSFPPFGGISAARLDSNAPLEKGQRQRSQPKHEVVEPPPVKTGTLRGRKAPPRAGSSSSA
jgi:hypothetical protein